MKVKKNKSKQLSISEVNTKYVIVVKHCKIWCIMQAETFDANIYRMVALGDCNEGSSLTVNNGYGPETIEEWFNKCEEMHAFKTTKEAFKFLIKKL